MNSTTRGARRCSLILRWSRRTHRARKIGGSRPFFCAPPSRRSRSNKCRRAWSFPSRRGSSRCRLSCRPARAARDAYTRRMQRRNLAFTIAAFIAGVCITLAATVSLSRYGAHSELIAGAAQGPALAHLAATALTARGRRNAGLARQCAARRRGRTGAWHSAEPEGRRGSNSSAAKSAARPTISRPVSISSMRRRRPSCSASPRRKCRAPPMCKALRSPRRIRSIGAKGRAFMRSRRPFKSAKLIALARRIHAALPEPPPE